MLIMIILILILALMIILICNYMRSGCKLQVEPVPDSVRLREAENISWIKFLAHSSRILFFLFFIFFDKLSRFQCQCRFLQSYPTPLPALQSLLSESSLPWPNAAPALSTLRLEAFGHLSPALCLALGPSISHSLAVSLPLDLPPQIPMAIPMPCVFFNGFLANVLGAAVGPSPSRSHEPYSIDFQLRRGLSYATTLRWPNQSFDYRQNQKPHTR